MKRGMVFGGIIVAAMLAFELFNYTTTDFALTDLLGDLRFAGLRWATILAIAFCGMDFAGIARLFTPGRARGERAEVWYLLAAWFLAATMNAMLTWWGVSLALLQHGTLGNEILSRDTLLSTVPVFVAMLVWLIRILLIGLLSMTGERIFSYLDDVQRGAEARRLPTAELARSASRPAPVRAAGDRPVTVAERHGYPRNPHSTSRPANAAPLPASVVRPVPKPAASGTRQPAREPAMARAHGNGNGNGNGHSYSGARSSNGHEADDFDL